MSLFWRKIDISDLKIECEGELVYLSFEKDDRLLEIVPTCSNLGVVLTVYAKSGETTRVLRRLRLEMSLGDFLDRGFNQHRPRILDLVWPTKTQLLKKKFN